MQHELKQFLRRIFKDNAEKILRHHLNSLGLSNVDAASPIQRKKLAEGLKNAFPYASVTKTSIIYAQLLNILNVELVDIGKEKKFSKDIIYYDEDGNEISGEDVFYNEKNKMFFASKEELYSYKIEKQKKSINNFWKKIDTSLTKFEVIYNLFWLKAGEAEIKGVDHDDVMKITNKSLIGIKKDLENSFKAIKQEFNIKENIEKNQKFEFHLKKLPDMKNFFLKNNKKLDLGEKEILIEIKNFWDKIDILYNDFRKLFIISLNKEIELKKNNLDDKQLIETTQENMLKIWNKIEKEYENLKKNIESIQNNYLNKVKNDEE